MVNLRGRSAQARAARARLQLAADRGARRRPGGRGSPGRRRGVRLRRAVVHLGAAAAGPPRRSTSDLLGAVCAAAEALVVGDPLDEATQVGPLIDEGQAERVAQLDRRGGDRRGPARHRRGAATARCVTPTVIDCPPDSVRPLASGGLRPRGRRPPLRHVRRGARRWPTTATSGSTPACSPTTSPRPSGPCERLDFGGVLVNEVPTWRADQQPYGGVRDAGNTLEGPAYAVEEMTRLRFVSLQPPARP